MSGGSRVVLAAAIWVVVLAGCGGQQLVKPKAIAFEPTIVGCSLPTECTSANRVMLRESREASKHLCPADKPDVLMKADGALVCVDKLPQPVPPSISGISIPSAVSTHGASSIANFKAGQAVAATSGCEACHRIGEAGNDGPGPELTHVASRLPRQAIVRTLVNPTAPMPSFKNLPPEKFNAIVYFLAQLR